MKTNTYKYLIWLFIVVSASHEVVYTQSLLLGLKKPRKYRGSDLWK